MYYYYAYNQIQHTASATNQRATEQPRAQVLHMGSHARANGNATVNNATVTHTNSKLIKDCEQCATTYQAKVIWQRFCSPTCKQAHHADRHDGLALNPGRYHKKAQA